jgi:hypothetical protein
MNKTMGQGLMVVASCALVATSCQGVLAIDDFGHQGEAGTGGTEGDPPEDGGAGGGGGAGPTAQFDWCLGFGADQTDRGMAIATDGEDHIIVAGTISGSVNFGGGTLGAEGSQGLAVVKLDGAGNHLKSFAAAGAGIAEPQAIAVGASGSVVIVGEYRDGPIELGSHQLPQPVGRDIFVAKFDSNLNPQLAVAFTDSGSAAGEQDQYATAVALAPQDGGLVLGGTMAGVITIGAETLTSAGGTDGFLVKLDAQGTPVWSQSFGDGEDQEVAALAMDENGNLVVAGSFSGSLDLGGTALQASGPSDGFVAKLTGAGAHQLSVSFGSSVSQTVATAVGLTDGGGLVVAGQFVQELSFGDTTLEGLDGEDIFVAALAADGELDWTVGVAGTGPDLAHAVAIGTDGSVNVAGSYSGMLVLPTQPDHDSQGGQDALVFKLSPSGKLIWAFDFGRNDDDQAFDMAIDSTNALLLTGGFHSGFSVNGEVLTAAGAEDIFISKLGD